MAYAEKVPSPKGDYWRGRYKDADGSYVSVRDDDDNVIRFTTERKAKKAADAKETAAEKGELPSGGNVLFREWASHWLAAQNTAWSSIVNRRHHLENHLIPFFGEYTLRWIEAHPELVTQWEKEERKYRKKDGSRYEESSISAWRDTLALCLGDAVPKRISANPAARQKGRGRSAPARGARKRKVITGFLGIFLIAERMSILSGRDDEFIMVQAGYGHALRLGETIGLEREFVTAAGIDVQWQLHKLDPGDNEELRAEAPGNLLRCPPKHGSTGLVPSPPYLASMLAEFIRANPRQPCECHGRVYVFNGAGERPRPAANVTMAELAAASGVSQSSVSAVINGTANVSPAVRAKVERAMGESGYVRPERPGGTSRHWRANDFERSFSAAASGWRKSRDGEPARRVLAAGEWPGTWVRGRNAEGRAEWCWAPVAAGMTPHGWRHALKVLLEGNGVPEVASEERMRHLLPGVSGVYRQTTPAMEEHLLGVLQGKWEETLDARLAMSPSSPVRIVDRLLRERAEARKPRIVPRNSPEERDQVVLLPARKAADLGRRDGR